MNDPATRSRSNPIPEDIHVDGTGHFHDESEGSEFVDESLRMVEQPFGYSEEHIAPGSPENLL